MVAGDYLPLELISDVLSRLPAKSIGRFRCVCKDWQILLSDPQFIKIHFNLQNRRATKAVFLNESSLISIDFQKDGNNNGSPVPIYETLNFKDLSYRYMIEGSCNGLLLLLDTKFDELWIINPITRASRKLPAFLPKTANYRTFGFGYNASIDDYIVAVIVQNRTGHLSVYVLKRNCWTMVNNCPSAFAFGSAGSCIIWNGTIHMLSYQISDKSRIIYALDLASERFREVEQPEGLKEQHVSFLNVNVLGGCLCLVSCQHNTGIANTDIRDIWLMKEYGVSKSWSKYYTFTFDLFTRFQPLFLWGGDEFMVGVVNGRVTLFSLNKPQMMPVFAQQCPFLKSWTFTDSLFSPNHNNVVDEPNKGYEV